MQAADTNDQIKIMIIFGCEVRQEINTAQLKSSIHIISYVQRRINGQTQRRNQERDGWSLFPFV